MKQIPLSQGKVALVDDADFDGLNRHKWCAVRVRRKTMPDVFYAVRAINYRRADGSKTCRLEYMHRVLVPDAPDVDHQDGSTLNNQRYNLRPATRSQNIANTPKRSGTTSRFRGVCRSQRGRWIAAIRHLGHTTHLGTYEREEDAAHAYDAAARRVFGEFARLNFPRDGEMPIR